LSNLSGSCDSDLLSMDFHPVFRSIDIYPAGYLASDGQTVLYAGISHITIDAYAARWLLDTASPSNTPGTVAAGSVEGVIDAGPGGFLAPWDGTMYLTDIAGLTGDPDSPHGDIFGRVDIDFADFTTTTSTYYALYMAYDQIEGSASRADT